MGFAGKIASRALRHSAVATATVTRAAPQDLRLFRLKRDPIIIIQRLPKEPEIIANLIIMTSD